MRRSMNPSITGPPGSEVAGTPTYISRQYRPPVTASRTMSESSAARTRPAISPPRVCTPSATAWASANRSTSDPVSRSTDWRTACTARPMEVPARPRRQGGRSMSGAPQRINTIIDYEAVARLGVHAQGTHAIASSTLLAEVTGLVADGSVEIPVARTFPLDQVRDAYNELAERHSHGKIVLIP